MQQVAQAVKRACVQKVLAPAPPDTGLTPPPEELPYGAAGDLGFSTGLCDCCAGTAGAQTCLVAWCLPCIAHGVIADAASGGRGQTPPCMLYTAGWLLSAILGAPNTFSCVLGTLARSKFRNKYNLTGSTLNDCCLHVWCDTARPPIRSFYIVACSTHSTAAARPLPSRAGGGGGLACAGHITALRSPRLARLMSH